jgi:hypothetical protein
MDAFAWLPVGGGQQQHWADRLGSCLWDQRHRARLPWSTHGRRSGAGGQTCGARVVDLHGELTMLAARDAALHMERRHADTQTCRHADMQTRRHGLSHVSPCLVQGCLALQAAPWLDMLPARELRISISPKASPKLARGWALSRRDSRIIIPRRTAAAGLLPNPQAPRETSAKSAQRNALPLRRRPRPVTAQRIMQRANAHAGAYLHDSSSIKALPPQSAMCCHAAAARRLPPSRQGCNSSTPATAVCF